MGRMRFRLIVAVLAVFSLAATACFQIIAFETSKGAISLGEKVKIKMDLGRVSSGLDNNAYTFLLIGLGSTLDLVTVSKFDKQENFGGKFVSFKHNALRDLLLSGGDCVSGGWDADDMEGTFSTWAAYRTTVKVNSAAGAFGEVNRVVAKVQRNGGANNSFGSFIVFVGQYTDANNDSIPQTGETFCSNVITGTIPFEP
jgi:hypothetical protein